MPNPRVSAQSALVMESLGELLAVSKYRPVLPGQQASALDGTCTVDAAMKRCWLARCSPSGGSMRTRSRSGRSVG